MHIRFQPKTRPINRIPNDNWPEVPPIGVFAGGVFDLMYAGIYVAGWNMWFATPVENLLWRISTATVLGIVLTYLVVELYTFHLLPALPARLRNIFKLRTPLELSGRLRKKIPEGVTKAVNWLRNNSPNSDPEFYYPLKASIPITIAAFIYATVRAYILLECLVALRELPSSAYQTVKWSAFLPHV